MSLPDNFSQTSDSSHDTHMDDGMTHEEMYWKYRAKCLKLLYKAQREFIKAGDRLARVEALLRDTAPPNCPATSALSA